MTTITSKNLTTTHCYIRATAFGKIGVHRIGAIALAPIAGDPTKVRVAWSLCSKQDNFNTDFARKSAVGRLNSDATSVVLDRNSNAIVMDSGILTALNKFRASNERFQLEESIQGALFDLTSDAVKA